jgi:hypothetical protein
MIRRIILIVGILMLLLPAAVALAGGWVVISLDALPDHIRAGEPVTLSFMVRQHGRTPIHDVEPKLTATNVETGQQIEASAEPMKELGRFIVTVDFPSKGLWEWSISAEPFPQTMTFAPLIVQSAPGLASPEPNSQPTLAMQTTLRWGGLVLLVAAVTLFAVSRRRERSATTPVSGD